MRRRDDWERETLPSQAGFRGTQDRSCAHAPCENLLARAEPRAPGTRISPASATAGLEAACYSKPFLEGGETILAVFKPSPFSIVLGALPQLAAIGGLVLLAVFFAHQIAPADRNIGALALASLILGWHLFDWLGKSFILTDRRVIRTHGVFRLSLEAVRLSDVLNLSLERHLLQQMAGMANLHVDAKKGPAMIWEDLGASQDVLDAVADAVNRYGK